MKLTIKKGTTSKLLRIFITDSSKTDGSGLTGLVYNTASLTAYYIREGAASATVITLVTATVGTYTASGFIEVDAANMPGVYELHPPNAVIASGADSVLIFLKGAANMAPLPLEIQLDDNTTADVYSRVGAPAGASIAADIADVPTVDQIADGVWDELKSGHAIDGSFGDLVDEPLSRGDVAIGVWDEPQFAHQAGGSFGAIATEIADILEDTNELQTNQGDWLTATGFSVPNEYDTVIAALQTDLDNPDQYKADVSALATVTDLKQHDNKITGLISMDDDLDLSPETWLLFNASDDLIGIRKFGPNKAQYDLEIKDAMVTDRVVDDSKTIKYSSWVKSWESGV